MATRRNALGRGLGALIPPQPSSETALRVATDAEDPARKAGVLELPVAAIRPNPAQPRRVFDAEELAALADSIRRHGLLQPVVVRRSDDEGYELVVGERRWRASQLAGREHIPAVVKDVSAPDLLEVALVENVQRCDLNPIELGLAFRTLLEAGATQEQVGQRVGLDRSTVANHVRLLELPRELQADVENGTLTMGHARTLLQVGNPERRRQLRDRIVGEDLSVRATEEQARRLASSASTRRRSPRRASVDPNLQGLLDALRDHLQTKVGISGSAARGKLEIEFYGPEELHRISASILDGR